jgi:hypothetical protein
VTAGATGTVAFFDSGAFLGTSVIAGGQAVFTTRLLAAGSRSLTATYAGDPSHAPSSSSASLQTVNAAQSSGLSAAVSYPTWTSPWAVGTGDFNGDGITDLVTVYRFANTVSVLLGKGDGTFGTKADYNLGSPASAVQVGDFNNDGKNDLAVLSGTNNVSILLGNGDGTFQAAVNYATVKQPTALAVADFNGDGKADLALANHSDNSISILLGNGDGTFQAAASTLAAIAVHGIAVGDFNGDGKTDIAFTGFGLSVLLGNGDGTFQTSFSAGVNLAWAAMRRAQPAAIHPEPASATPIPIAFRPDKTWSRSVTDNSVAGRGRRTEAHRRVPVTDSTSRQDGAQNCDA